MLSKLVKNWSFWFAAMLTMMVTVEAKAEDFPFVCGTAAPELQGFRVLTCDHCGDQKVHGVILYEPNGEEPMNVSIFESEDKTAWMIRGTSGRFLKRRYLLAKIVKADPSKSFVDYRIKSLGGRPTMGTQWYPANCR